ncbi:hypothetical protein EII32_04395 [Prevotella sp. OH937_COT-195]|nr:hypothetical protein EII32_04395 [Prevotella sp. OH937_COT-195]
MSLSLHRVFHSIRFKVNKVGVRRYSFFYFCKSAMFKPKSVIRPHFLRFAIAVTLPDCFSPLAAICAAITSRRSPLRLR